MPVTATARPGSAGCHIPCMSGWALASPRVPCQSRTTHITVKSARVHVRALACGSAQLAHGASQKRSGRWRRGGGGHAEPSNLSPPDKPPRDALTFPPPKLSTCEDVQALAHVPSYTFVCACAPPFIYACRSKRPLILRAKLMRNPAVAGNKSRHMKDDTLFFIIVPHLKMLALAFCCLDSKIYARVGGVGEGGVWWSRAFLGTATRLLSSVPTCWSMGKEQRVDFIWLDVDSWLRRQVKSNYLKFVY